MTQEERWQAVCANDASFDGVFFYAVRSTGIFCRPSCRSRPPKPANVLYFDTAAEAMAAGFRPCKRCRSDLVGPAPSLALAQQAKALLDASYCKRDELQTEWKRLGVSPRRLDELFQQAYGVTPTQYAATLRLTEAKRLLRDTDEPIVSVADQVGFGGLSSFYRFFRNGAGLSPAAYRKENHR